MKEYTDEFKKQAVDFYTNSPYSLRYCARKFDIPETTFTYWVACDNKKLIEESNFFSNENKKHLQYALSLEPNTDFWKVGLIYVYENYPYNFPQISKIFKTSKTNCYNICVYKKDVIIQKVKNHILYINCKTLQEIVDIIQNTFYEEIRQRKDFFPKFKKCNEINIKNYQTTVPQESQELKLQQNQEEFVKISFKEYKFMQDEIEQLKTTVNKLKRTIQSLLGEM